MEKSFLLPKIFKEIPISGIILQCPRSRTKAMMTCEGKTPIEE
jgi:hypothetical protein